MIGHGKRSPSKEKENTKKTSTTIQQDTPSASSGLPHEERSTAKEQSSIPKKPTKVMVRPFENPEEPPTRPRMTEHIQKQIRTWSQDLTEEEVVQIYGDCMRGMDTRQRRAEESHAYHQRVNPTDTASWRQKT